MTSAGAEKCFTTLISSAGRRVSLLRSIREATQAAGLRARVIACDLTDLTPAMQLADDRFIVPRCTDPGFIDAVRTVCATQQVDLVIPTIDTELPVWAELRGSLSLAGTTVAVSTPEAVAVAADKRRTNEHCARIGIPVPRQSTIETVDRNRGKWTLPIIVKPATGSASHGLQVVHSWAQFDQILRISPTKNLVVEEGLKGSEHTVDVYVDRCGRAHCPVVRRRLEVRAGEVSKARVVRDDLLAKMAVEVVERLPGAYGVLNVQIFSDGTTAGVIEINARFGGGYPLTWRAGGRYGEWLIREVAFGELPPSDPSVSHDLTMLRWDEEVFVDA